MSRIIIFANGNLPNLEKARALIRPEDFILCADGGTRHALALGLTPNIVIGDLDSVTDEERRKMKEWGVAVIEFSRDKNETDLELAIQHALTLNPQEIIIIGALGGRLDQTLGNIALISNLQPATCNLKLNDGLEEVFFCHDHAEVNGAAGDIVSLIPWQGEVTGILTHGLKWVLQNETLYPHKTRGISNEMTGDTATIKIKSGLLLVVHRCETVIGNW